MPGERIKQSKFMQRCVADVTGQGKPTDAAFAICTAQQQRAGYAAPGSRTLTAKGKRRERQFGKERDMPEKRRAYLAATGRAEEESTIRGMLEALEAGAPVAEGGDEQAYASDVADEILRQLGGRRFIVMTGARDMTYSKQLDGARKWPTFTVKFPHGNAKILRIALAPSDTYTVQFMTRTGKVIKELDDIYAEQLPDVVAQGTGLALHL